jgi:hypothetical protein
MIIVYIVKDLDSHNLYSISAHDLHRIDGSISSLGDREVASTFTLYDTATDVDWDTLIYAKIELGKDGLIVDEENLEEDIQMITSHPFITELSSDAREILNGVR